MSIYPEFRIMISLVVCLLLLSGCASRSGNLPVPVPFTQVPTDFTHVWTKGTHPFTGASVIDIDGDGQFEIFVGGGEGQGDALLSYRNGRLVNIEDGTDLSHTSATYGSTAIDMDADGDTDLIVARENGVYLYLIDLDSDGWQDLVVSQNTGAVEVFRNMKDRTFQPVATKSAFGFWMALAVGDIDNDGDQDLFFTNVGGSIPLFLTSGDLQDGQRHTHEWMLWRNDGDFHFTDVTDAYRLTGEGFAWGAVFEDLNLDGQLDLFVAQNYIKWPIHKLFKLSGRTYLQSNEDDKHAFHHTQALGLDNRYFGQSPLIVDLDGDGRQDLLWINMDGPVRAFLNTSPGNYITIVVPDTVAALGTRISIETDKGQSYTRAAIGSVGMLTDQTPELSFGVGDLEQVRRVVIQRPNGQTEIISSPPINKKTVID